MILLDPYIMILIGASLSDPYASGTALRKCVNVRVCLLACLWPYTINLRKYFLKIERPCALCMAMLGYCQSAALATVVETAQV